MQSLYPPRAPQHPGGLAAPHKTVLFETLILKNFAAFREVIAQKLGGDMAARRRLEWLLSEQVKLVDAHTPLLVTLQNDPLRERYDDAFMEDHYTWLRQHITALMHRAQAEGELRELDIFFTTALILRSVAPINLTYQRHDLRHSLKHVSLGVTQLLARPCYALH